VSELNFTPCSNNSFLISEVFIKTFFYSVKFEIEKESVIMLNFIASINELFWGAILILLLVGTGIFYTLKLKFVQVRKFRKGVSQLTGDFDINGKDADHNGMSSFQALATAIAAKVPLSEMFGYATDLRSNTQGRAAFSMEFSNYEKVPAMIEKKIIEERAGKVKKMDEE